MRIMINFGHSKTGYKRSSTAKHITIIVTHLILSDNYCMNLNNLSLKSIVNNLSDSFEISLQDRYIIFTNYNEKNIQKYLESINKIVKKNIVKYIRRGLCIGNKL